MFKLLGSVLLAAALLVPATPAAASSAKHERVYFQCGENRVANFDSAPAGWAKQPPTTTVKDGGGCAQGDVAGYSSSAGPVTATTGRWAGTFTGNLHGFNIRLDTISVGTVLAGGRAEFDFSLKVDGKDALGGVRRLGVQPVLASSGNTYSYFFSVAGLPFTDIVDDRTHTIEITAEPTNQQAVAWVYGAKDAPSGIEFNPTANHPYVITPQL
jgi:hypothetical protein